MKKVIYLLFGFLSCTFWACDNNESQNKGTNIDLDSIQTTEKGPQDQSCSCRENDSLKLFIQEGTIPNLWETSNNKHFEDWSTSVLKPTGDMPKVLLPEEADSDASLARHEQWTCMYSAYSLMDHDPGTAWAEGINGNGIGEIVVARVDLDKPVKIWAGFGKTKELFLANNRPRSIKVYVMQSNYIPGQAQPGISYNDLKVLTVFETELKDVNNYQLLNLPQVTLKTYQNDDQELYYPTFAAIEILSVYAGSRFEDTCISEITN